MATPFCYKSRERRRFSVCVESIEIKMKLFVKLLKFAATAILTFYLCCFWMFCMNAAIVLNEIFIAPAESRGAVAVTPTVLREKNTWTREAGTQWEQTRKYGPDKVKVKENSRNGDDKNPSKNAAENATHHRNNINHRNISAGVTRNCLINATQKAAVIPMKSLQFNNSDGSRLSQVGMHFGCVGAASNDILIMAISSEESAVHRMSPDDLEPQLLHTEKPLTRGLSISDKSSQDTTKVTLVFDEYVQLVIVDADQSQIASIIVSKNLGFSEVHTWVIEVFRVDKRQTALTVSKGTLGKPEVAKSEAVLKTIVTMVAKTFKFPEVDEIQRLPMNLTRALTIRPEDVCTQTTPTFGKEALLSESVGERVSPKVTPSDLAQHGLSMNRLAPNGLLIYRTSSLDTTGLNTESSLAFPKLDGKSSQESQRPNLFRNEADNLISNMTQGNPSSVLLNFGECADVTSWTILLLLPLIL